MRLLHTSAPLRALRPAVKPHRPQRANQAFDKSFASGGNAAPQQKIWDKQGISKDDFFGRKYGNISAERRQQLDDKVARQRYLRGERKKHEQGERRLPTVLNPLCEYVFGTHPVVAALSGGKRAAFSRLYVHNCKHERILALAKRYGVKVVEKHTKGEMNTLSLNGVHNGVVLETKPLVVPYVEVLGAADGAGTYTLTVDTGIESTTSTLAVARPPQPGRSHYPLGVFVDGITDPQNMGSIVRSAYYLGADFLVVPELDTARLGPVAAKASAGALDLLPVYKVGQPLHFLDAIRKNGWNVVATSSTDMGDMKDKHREQVQSRFVDYAGLPAVMDTAPMLMVLGSEGAGVRTNLKLRLDYLVGLASGRAEDDVVDSLNVGVAAAMLIGKAFE